MRTLILNLNDRLQYASRGNKDQGAHLAGAADWLLNAHDVAGKRGVSAWYDLKNRSWKAAYPETTGYIIPTLYDYAEFSGRAEFRDAACCMAEWEADIQLEGGGVRAGTIDSDVVEPTIFNTGQVLFGWARAWQETGSERFRNALIRAADWLVEAQDADGAWRRFGSPFVAQQHQVNSYNTRTAFGLACAGDVLSDRRYLDAAIANVEWALDHSRANGWLDDNDLEVKKGSLSHTIAYSIRGILEVGAIAGKSEYIDAAARMARAVAASQRQDGAVPGRLDHEWKPTTRWSCITGNAQMAICWLRLVELAGEKEFLAHAQRANHFNLSIHDLTSRNPNIRGGVKGSHPISGGYMTYRYPNWAAKFFMDALMLEQRVLSV